MRTTFLLRHLPTREHEKLIPHRQGVEKDHQRGLKNPIQKGKGKRKRKGKSLRVNAHVVPVRDKRSERHWKEGDAGGRNQHTLLLHSMRCFIFQPRLIPLVGRSDILR